MQKWCPEPLVVEAGTVNGFQSLAGAEVDGAGVATAPGPTPETMFRGEAGFSDPSQLMRQLTADERTQVFELVELDVAREYEQRQREAETGYQNNLQRLEKDLAAEARNWREVFGAAIKADREQTVHDLAAEAVQLSLRTAEKIVRQRVELDDGVLVRAIEAILYRLDAGVALTVTVNPADAERLAEAEELCADLGIASIMADRRIDAGGCLVSADRREWDATIGEQLATLGEAINEAMATGPRRVPDPDGDHEPAVE
jgi:flagellar biosynthesis/type III secretory pathway protein FliH